MLVVESILGLIWGFLPNNPVNKLTAFSYFVSEVLFIVAMETDAVLN